MPHYRIHIDETLPVDVSRAFAAMADHEGFGRLIMVPVKRLVDGQGDINGVGSVRRIGPPVLGVEETITAIEPNQYIRYKITRGGFPMSNHSGEIRFQALPTGSRVEWHIEFDMPPVLGDGVRAMLEKTLTQGVRRIR